jgi:hypothetical protein
MKRSLALACALALIGCASHPEWSKDGTSPDLAARELADCQSIAREATQRDTNIMTDILATRGNDWQRTGVMDTHVQTFNVENRTRGDDIVNRCMIGKGFVPGG